MKKKNYYSIFHGIQIIKVPYIDNEYIEKIIIIIFHPFIWNWTQVGFNTDFEKHNKKRDVLEDVSIKFKISNLLFYQDHLADTRI